MGTSKFPVPLLVFTSSFGWYTNSVAKVAGVATDFAERGIKRRGDTSLLIFNTSKILVSGVQGS